MHTLAHKPLLLTLLWAAACTGNAAEPPSPSPAPAGPTTAADAPSPPASGAPAAGAPASTAQPATPATLPDLATGLEKGSCSNGPGNEGADSHFIGGFTVSGNSVRGTERWLLEANPKLMASKLWDAGSSCEIRWMVSGTSVPPKHCGDCDLGLILTANVDKTGSTCPEDMVDREESFEVGYDVRRASDGVAYFYFAKSGKLLGQGYHQGDQLSYLTQHQCKWF